MKMRYRSLAITVLVVVGFVLAMCPGTASAATTAQKQTAINSGLQYLAGSQQADGRWEDGDASYDSAATAAAVRAFMGAGYHAGSDVIINSVNYGDVIGNGMDHLFSGGVTCPISVQSAGDPDSNGNGLGVKFMPGNLYYRSTFVTGAVLPAIIDTGTPGAVVSSGPLAGLTYQQVVEDTVDYLAYGQNETGSPSHRGGWRYSENYGQADQSCSPWPVLGMLSSREWGFDAPPWVESELDLWMNAIQRPDGGAGYMPGYSGNIYRTGSLLSQKHYSHDSTDEGAVQMALDFINNRWQTSGTDGNFANPGALWATFQGLRDIVGLDDTTWITNLRPPGPLDPDATWTWAEDYAEYLVNMQQADGRWNGAVYYNTMQTTAWYIDVLSGTMIPEPSTLALLGFGGTMLFRRRRARC